MLDDLRLDYVLFLDIETVPAFPGFEKLPDGTKKLWEKKAELLMRNDPETTADKLYARAGIYAEFGKIVCISCGFVNGKEFRIKSFYGDDEQILLEEFAHMLNKHYDTDRYLLCAHNGKEFDFPYIARRMLINSIKLPRILDSAGKKPWEVRHLDTMELWKFGDYKHFTSLELLASVFNIPTPKDDIDGSMVGHVYWEEKDLERIVTYCQKDVITIAQLLRRYMGLPLISEADIQYA
ncbi:MAG: 3'-5' exonuclease [Bacteroidetes bacterium]|nr:MAG: 3'-5' exonuclease [Bacteroidota bacterium]RLD47140.1 MAG: 3'-5' exonuclease [Bacteroidota bacterium]RLD74526.1 MAG: 3'-5' exonuclease [Bacteroidota bacterium]RLD86854.1 MAG: 3'-5' exonuclease [Bacteroidota bacterium]HHL57836.1 3'-5' exonuclease [Bacteroidota bacterium]